MEYLVNIVLIGLIVLAGINARERRLFEMTLRLVAMLLSATLAIRYWPLLCYLLGHYVLPQPELAMFSSFWLAFLPPYLIFGQLAVRWAQVLKFKFVPLIRRPGCAMLGAAESAVVLACLMMSIVGPLKQWTEFDTSRIILSADQAPINAYRWLQQRWASAEELRSPMNRFPEEFWNRPRKDPQAPESNGQPTVPPNE